MDRPEWTIVQKKHRFVSVERFEVAKTAASFAELLTLLQSPFHKPPREVLFEKSK